MRKSFFIGVLLAAGIATEAGAACNSTVNGRPMSVQECEMARQIYGSYPRGHYLRDRHGNWVNRYDPSERGNVFLDAQRGGYGGGSGGGRHWSDGEGCVRTEFGSVC